MSVEAHDLDWYLGNQIAYDALTVEQVHALGRGELVEYGDTEAAPADEESSGSPAAAEKGTEEVKSTPEAKPEEVLLAKDGKHTIPFSELEDARAKAAELEALSKQQATLIDELKAAKEADKGTGATEAQDEVMASFKTTYPELAEMLGPVVQKMIDAGVNAKVEALERKFADALTPLQKTAQDNSKDAHFTTIRDAHDDFDAIIDSGDLAKWVETLPSYAKTGAAQVLKAGTAEEVIELLGQYKATLAPKGEPKPAADTPEQIAAKAKEVIAKAQRKPVTSLSDIPASSGTEANEEPTTVQGWSKKFAGMTPAQIQKELAR